MHLRSPRNKLPEEPALEMLHLALDSPPFGMSAFLVTPDQSLEREFLALYEECSHAGEREWCETAGESQINFPAYVSRLKGEATSQGISSDWAPTSHFWLMGRERLIGTLRIRHYLTPAVEERAGHIGYDISPSFRGQGYGHQILALGLNEARRIGIQSVLAICDETNAPSKSILQKAGGVITRTRNGEIWYVLE